MPTDIPDVFSDVLQEPEVETRVFGEEGNFPNNPDLPVLFLRHAVHAEDDVASTLERVFGAHGWKRSWRNGVFSYHHYHSTAHEVLGVARGFGSIELGGPSGEVFQVSGGDVLVLPAGVSHKSAGSTTDFVIVGAYPESSADWDLLRGLPDERPQADRNIEQVPLPNADPVLGSEGPLIEHWKRRD